MASIVGEPHEGKPYHNADGWFVTDKIFGYLDKAGKIYNKIRFPQPGDPDYNAMEAKLRTEQIGMFNLPKPWGALLLVGGITLLAYGIYKIAN